jgi:hypothetical protein
MLKFLWKQTQLRIEEKFISYRYDKILIAFDGKNFINFTPDMLIPKKYLGLQGLKIKLRYIDAKKFTEYVSDLIPLTKFADINEEVKHPKSIRSLEERVTTLEAEFKRLLQNTKELRDVVKEIYEEGDII